MNNVKGTTIIYVNFAPYENAGKILDFLLEKFGTVLVFTFNFHHLGKNQEPSSLRVYVKGTIAYRTRLFQTPTSASLAFILLPLRSLVIFLQMLYHTIRLKSAYGPYDVFFTVNAFTAWTGNVLRSLGVVNKTVFWVWDYYPPVHKNSITKFMRWLYWIFDKPASLEADRTVFLNRRLEDLRKKIGILPKNAHYPVVPVSTYPARTHSNTAKSLSLVFFGVLKKSQGLDLLFDAGGGLHHRFPRLTLHVIGGGPDGVYFTQRASRAPFRTIFHGYLPNEKLVDEILATCHIGLATYVPEASNVSYYSDPSKIKKYISLGLPVITTNVFEFSRELSRNRAGAIIDYFRPGSLIAAIARIEKHYGAYRKGARTLAAKYYYKRLYPKLFQ